MYSEAIREYCSVEQVISECLATGYKCKLVPKYPDCDHMAVGGGDAMVVMARSPLWTVKHLFQSCHDFGLPLNK